MISERATYTRLLIFLIISFTEMIVMDFLFSIEHCEQFSQWTLIVDNKN